MAEPASLTLGTLGRLQAFNPDEENISSYLEQVQLYFEANEVKPEKQVAVLLTVIGPKNYGIIRSLRHLETKLLQSCLQL